MKEIPKPLGELITELEIPPRALDQIVGWSAKEKKTYTLRNFVASRAPETAKRFELTESDSLSCVKRITELTEQELKRTVCESLRRGSTDMKVGVMGSVGEKKDFSKEELVKEVEKGTQTGNAVIEAYKLDIDLIERLAEKGKLYPGKPPKGPIKPPWPGA